MWFDFVVLRQVGLINWEVGKGNGEVGLGVEDDVGDGNNVQYIDGPV